MWLLVILKNVFVRDNRIVLVTKSFQACAHICISMIIQVYNFYFYFRFLYFLSFLIFLFPSSFPSETFFLPLPPSPSSSALPFSVIFSQGDRNPLFLHVTVCISLMDSVCLCFGVSLYLYFFSFTFFLVNNYWVAICAKQCTWALGDVWGKQKEGSAWFSLSEDPAV